MTRTTSNRSSILELEDVAQKHTVEALELKVDRCYSQDRYADFQEAVENIIHRQLGTDTAREKLNSYISGKIDASLADRSWKTKTFWVPTIISILSLTAVVILSVIYHKT